jgi:Holliday junction resolvasome RuvABC endonuclease subunit
MKILAIDPATQLGYAYTKKSGGVAHGSESFHNNKWDGSGVRFMKFKAWLETFTDIDLLVYEAVENHTSTYAAHAYGGWISILQAHCEEKQIPYTGYAVGTIKKFWTGKGNAKKPDMIRCARERGYNPEDDNAADALAIYHLGLESFNIKD